MEPDHTPNPQRSRGVYGFVLSMFFVLFIIIYVLWLIIPTSVTKTWEYEPPQKYWAVATPIFFCTALFLFAFCIYPAMHSRFDGELHELSAIQDCHSIRNSNISSEIPCYDDDIDDGNINIGSEEPNRNRKRKGKQENYKKSDKIINLKLYDDTITTRAKSHPKRRIQPASDLDLDQVCKLLYLRDN